MKKSRSGYEETLGSNLVEVPADSAAADDAPTAMTNGVKETSPIEDLATLVQTDQGWVFVSFDIYNSPCQSCFLDAFSYVYKRVCPTSVHRFVRRSVGPSHTS